LETNNKIDAIEFLLMAGKNDEAFNIAVSTNNMDGYVKTLKEVTPDEGLRIAQFWEGKGELGKAAKQYENSGQNLKALKLFIQSGETYFESAIELVARVKTENLVQILITFLTGESNNTPQDPRWLYKLFIALGNLDKAAKIAITISSEEQERGNYKAAHTILYETQRDLKEKNLGIPFDLYQRLLVLHSYIIVKRLVKMGEHDTAARMLNRVCKNISQFPAHDATILTSAVLQAMKANLKGLAFQWAITLMYPEYSPKIPEAHKDKITKIARKSVNEEVEEKSSPCPFCSVYSLFNHLIL
jgi:WD repeat-containing protein 19